MDWSQHYPAFYDSEHSKTMTNKLRKDVEVADIGCGFGGLLVALSPLFPDTLMIGKIKLNVIVSYAINSHLGMELRMQVLEYVKNRILALRSQNQTSTQNPGPYQNISGLRTNTMKFLPNFFKKSQLTKIFLCFPDPHFKQRKHKARIVSAQLNSEYAFVLRPGGRLYTITDVEELHQWIVKHFEGEESGDINELWERVSNKELESDPCVRVMMDETEEGKKVTRNGGKKFVAVWERKPDPEWQDIL